ncbi:gamma carbonic anhydrase family protein [Microbacterium gorillae]|uniref:gamma carbonic anhydrase family protein n=1 Tax=Microbacterium gorillae TaxID=1231063 RepID=UPI00058E2CB8|nr:gamma carbonic anhydrase family protein [Microbacterium gorillae]
MEYEHDGHVPHIHPDAVVAPSAIISGDVTLGAGCRVLHGAVITAEGGAITIGENAIIMENAVIRAVASAPVHIGDHVLIGPGASVSGATIEDEVFLATGTRVFNGARIGARSEVRINAVVHLRTTLPDDSVVPIGWVAIGDPVQILPPHEHEQIAAAQRELDFPGFVFGVDRTTPDLMVQVTERYGHSLARHRDDKPVTLERHGRRQHHHRHDV